MANQEHLDLLKQGVSANLGSPPVKKTASSSASVLPIEKALGEHSDEHALAHEAYHCCKSRKNCASHTLSAYGILKA